MEKRARNIADWLLLAVTVVFFVEFVVFFGSGIHHGFRPNGWRFILLAVATFLTSFVASVGFGRRVAHPFLLFLGLLLIQPAAGAVANAVVGRAGDLTVPILAGLAAVAVFVAAARTPNGPAAAN